MFGGDEVKATAVPQRSPRAPAQPRALIKSEDALPGPTVQTLAEEQHRAEMDRQDLRSKITNHEIRCEEHYTGIRNDMTELKATVAKVVDKVDIVLTNQAANAAVAAAAITHGRPKWWMQLAGAAIVGLIGWMASTIWSMEAAKVDALQHQPSAQVTVNPAQPQSPATSAPPIQVSPPIPTE